MGAHCDICDGRVMPYRRYAFWMKPTAECQECGASVRLRGFWTMFALGAAAFAGALATIAAFPSFGTGVGVAVALSLVLLIVDYGSYHVLTWEADHALLVPDEELSSLTEEKDHALHHAIPDQRREHEGGDRPLHGGRAGNARRGDDGESLA